ncbi:MAG: hypothetical protein ACXADH_01495 [Candidatus Kariarchaeaceae archaeon]|jgi:hypothetical protein
MRKRKLTILVMVVLLVQMITVTSQASAGNTSHGNGNSGDKECKIPQFAQAKIIEHVPESVLGKVGGDACDIRGSSSSG